MQAGSIVFHPLFKGPGVVVSVEDSPLGSIAKVLWQGILEYSLHRVTSLSHEPVPLHPDLQALEAERKK